jgi:sugar phosphate isomerase/epimerase
MRTRQTARLCEPSATAMGRRDWLRVAAATVAASQFPLLARPTCGAEDASLRAKAKKNVKLGVHTGPYVTLPLAEAARRIQAEGFTSVLTEYTFADVRFDPLAPDWQAAAKIVRTLEQHGIQIAAIFGYVNVVDPLPERQKRHEARMTCLIQNWKQLGCPNVSTETGTFNITSDWVDAPENATEAGYQKCRAAMEQLARMAEKAGAVVSIEPYWRNVIDSVDRAERLFRDIQSPGLRLVMDPCNYPRKEDLPQMRPLLEDMFRRLGDKIVVAHAKDVAASAEGTDLPAAGRGVLDYPHYLGLLAALDRPMHLILEHLVLDDVRRARDFVLGEFERV